MSQIIIFGVSNKKRAVESGAEFIQRCPHCGGTHTFRETESRPYFSLFFIPLFPIGKGTRLITCANCKTSFQFDPVAHQRDGRQRRAPSPARANDTIVIYCVHCGERLGIPLGASNAKEPVRTTCPHCQKSFELKL